MFISDPELKDAGAFRIFVAKAMEELSLSGEDEPEVWGLRAYCLRTAKKPAGLFVRALKQRQWAWVTDEDLKAGERDRLGEDAPVTALEREQLTAEIARHAGKCLEAGHGIRPNGIDHRRDGFLGWGKIPIAELRAFAEQVRDGRFGEPPEIMSFEEFARSELGESIPDPPVPEPGETPKRRQQRQERWNREVTHLLEAKARADAWWKLIGPKAQPQADLQGPSRSEPSLEVGGEISW